MSDEFQQDRETCERSSDGDWVADGGLVRRHGSTIVANARNTQDADFIARAHARWLPALDRIAALEAERDAAYARGWEAAKERAVEAARYAMPVSGLSDVLDAIRAITPEGKGGE